MSDNLVTHNHPEKMRQYFDQTNPDTYRGFIGFLMTERTSDKQKRLSNRLNRVLSSVGRPLM